MLLCQGKAYPNLLGKKGYVVVVLCQGKGGNRFIAIQCKQERIYSLLRIQGHDVKSVRGRVFKPSFCSKAVQLQL